MQRRGNIYTEKPTVKAPVVQKKPLNQVAKMESHGAESHSKCSEHCVVPYAHSAGFGLCPE